MSNYYTPEIKEFHPGFEYEVFKPSEDNPERKWEKMNFYFGEVDKTYNQTTMIINYHYHKDRIRVKHLDQQDIEDLGFKPLTEIMWNNGDWTITLVGRKTENPHYKITNSTYSSWVVFQGTIKNKSELKRILKQIRYYDK